MTYILILIIAIFYGIILNVLFKNRQKAQRYFCLIAATHFALFHALRDIFIYPDNANYAFAFDIIRDLNLEDVTIKINQYTQWGQGYVFLNWIIGRFTDNYRYFFYVTSVMMVFTTMWIIYKFSNSPILSVIAYILYPYMYYQSLYVLRQHMAAVLLLLAIYYIKRLKVSIPLFVIACTFHLSAIVFAPYYLVYHVVNLKKFSITQWVPIALIGMSMFNTVARWFVQYEERFDNYLEMENSNMLPVMAVGSLLVAHLFIGTHKKIKNEIDYNIFCYLIFSTFVLFSLIGTGGGRLASYFVYVIPLALPMLLKYRNNNKAIVSFITIYLVALLGVWINYSHSPSYHPYQMMNF